MIFGSMVVPLMHSNATPAAAAAVSAMLQTIAARTWRCEKGPLGSSSFDNA